MAEMSGPSGRDDWRELRQLLSEAPSRDDGLDDLRRLVEAVDREMTPLDELREVLVGPEQRQLRTLKERIDDPNFSIEGVSRVLPEAVIRRSKVDDDLTQALFPAVEEGISISVRRNPRKLVDAIAPVMGPAIRKAIANAFSQMVQSLNQTLEYSVSLRGLSWRFEAFRTGRPFSEVVLSHTLLYRVEQVFLIHRETGLLLRHVSAATGVVEDADLVSGMLTAIRDFVSDSFRQTGTLDTIEVGEMTVWIEQGPRAVLAAVIRGAAPLGLRAEMQDTLDRIHLDRAEELETFTGDAAAFETVETDLADCLKLQVNAPTQRPSPLLISATAAIVLGAGIWGYLAWRENREWTRYVDRLRAEPGIVVTAAEKRGGRYVIFGLRDALAADPADLLETTRLDPTDVAATWEPYQALHPTIVRQRAANILQPPPTVSLSVAGGVGTLEGIASGDWLAEARTLARVIPGIDRLDTDRVFDTDRIEKALFYFPNNRDELIPGQEATFDRLAADLKELAGKGKPVRVAIGGHADETGSEEINRSLRKRRAERVAAELIQRGVPAELLDASGAAMARGAALKSRCATFKVVPVQ